MKTNLFTLLGAVLLATPSVLGQPARAQQQVIYANPLPQDENLIKFDLDFPGGTPRQLVAAIEKSSSHPLNAVILDDDANVKLPPLKMKAVTAPELFEALAAASPRAEMHASGNYRSVPGGGIVPELYQYQLQYSFKTIGKPKDDSVWYFHAMKPSPVVEARACRFWQLTSHLETYKVEDITTAIQTGWKMLGETNPPTLSFHKDTKLLIAVGEESKLRMIDSVLEQLVKGKPPSQRESSGTKSAEPAKN